MTIEEIERIRSLLMKLMIEIDSLLTENTSKTINQRINLTKVNQESKPVTLYSKAANTEDKQVKRNNMKGPKSDAKRRLNDDKKKVMKLIERGYTYKEIALKYQMSLQTVSAWARSQGVRRKT